MCGIVGFINQENKNFNWEKILENMTREIKHRGPDAKGFYINKNIKFGHRRLIVVDPEGGKQPMIFKNLVIIYNGEIYNTQEVKKKLINLGENNFKTYSDTEIIIRSYARWKSDCVKYLDGIFAFAIYDQQEQKIFLARDRFGVKPLFYFFDQKNFAFSSEIKSLLVFPKVSSHVDRDGLQELLAIGPARTHGNGIFKDIKELEPGKFLEAKIFGDKIKLNKKKYFELEYREHKESLEQTAEHVYYLVKRAVKKQLISDVPIGCFLSGGLDSSIISFFAAQENKNLKTFSLDFKNNEIYFEKFADKKFQVESDNIWAKKMHEFINSDHNKIILDSRETGINLERAMIMRDLPGMADIDSSLMLFCREIKKNITVGLSGECADEIFGGYPWFYREDLKTQDNFPWSRDIKLRSSVLKINLDLENYSREKYITALNNTPEFFEKDQNEKYIRDLTYLNIIYFMSNLLERKDRMSMANGLEVRVPFCDHELVNYVFNIPWKIKFYNQREKGILRLAFKNILPDKILWRKKNPYPKSFVPEYTNLVFKMLDHELKNNILSEILDRDKIFELIYNKHPWYGQLMSGAQLAGYFYQIARWLKKYKIKLKI